MLCLYNTTKLREFKQIKCIQIWNEHQRFNTIIKWYRSVLVGLFRSFSATVDTNLNRASNMIHLLPVVKLNRWKHEH